MLGECMSPTLTTHSRKLSLHVLLIFLFFSPSHQRIDRNDSSNAWNDVCDTKCVAPCDNLLSNTNIINGDLWTNYLFYIIFPLFSILLILTHSFYPYFRAVLFLCQLFRLSCRFHSIYHYLGYLNLTLLFYFYLVELLLIYKILITILIFSPTIHFLMIHDHSIHPSSYIRLGSSRITRVHAYHGSLRITADQTRLRELNQQRRFWHADRLRRGRWRGALLCHGKLSILGKFEDRLIVRNLINTRAAPV